MTGHSPAMKIGLSEIGSDVNKELYTKPIHGLKSLPKVEKHNLLLEYAFY